MSENAIIIQRVINGFIKIQSHLENKPEDISV